MFTCFASTEVPVLTPDGDAELSVHNLKVLNLGSSSKGLGALLKQEVKLSKAVRSLGSSSKAQGEQTSQLAYADD